MRRIEVYGLPQVVSPEMLSGKLVVVIDVLRATTVITNALANGADGILIARSVEEAKMLAATHNGLLAGERDAIMIEGFDFGNSPLEFTSDKIFRRKIVLTTTNGTSTLLSAGSGERLVAACFNNISSIVKFILHNRQDVVIICSGTNGKFSLDDALVAGTIICKLAKEQEFVPDDQALALKILADKGTLACQTLILETAHARRLISLGFNNDIEFCLRVDNSNVVPIWNGMAFVKNA